MPRVCMVAYTQYLYDPRVRREAEALVNRGDIVDFICLDDEGNEFTNLLNGVRLIKIPVGRYRGSNTVQYILSYLQFFLMASLMLVRLQLKNSYQVIQIHTMPDFMVFVAIIPKLLGAKIILDVHDLMPELFESKFGYTDKHWLIRFITLVERLSIGFADRAIAVHQPHLEALSNHGNPSEKFIILLNLPDKKIFDRAADCPSQDATCFELIYHGTVSERHGLEVAIQAVASLREEIPLLKLIIWGDGDDISRLTELVLKMGLQENVQINVGMVPMEELVCEIKNADVGIVPILYDEFTKYMLPVKLLEYVGLGIPVICSRTKTIEAYFDDSMIQFSAPGSVKELSQNIRYLYQNPDKRRILVENAKRFNQEYNWEKQKQSYYNLIDDLLKV